MDVSLIIRLIDQFSQPASTVAKGLRKIGDTAKEMGHGFGLAIREGFSVENIEKSSRNAEQALERARGRLLGAFAMATTLAAPVVQSAQFDQSMRGLDKVLDVSSERLAKFRQFALDTSAQVPVAAKDLVELMAEAAQGGVPVDELEAFSLYVAKASVAFDMAGAEIGDRFAKLRNVYKLNQQGIEQLGDATNHLSNNMASKAPEVTDFVNRAAGGANMLKLTAVQTAAMGTAMVAAGIVPESAARGFNAMATKISVGGKNAEAAFKALGINRKQFVKDLEKDAPKALQRLFDTMNNSPKGMAALVDLVGMDFSDDFAKIVNNPDLIRKAFGYVADAQDYAGSATDEAAKMGEGAVKKWDLLLNKLSRLSVVIGDILLPGALEAADAIGKMVDQIAEFARANPELTSSAVQAGAALLGFAVAARVLQFAIAAIRLPLVSLAAFFLKFDDAGKNIATGWRMIAGAGSILSGAFAIVRAAAAAVVGAIGGISWPVVAVAAAIAAAGFAIYKYWDRISSFVAGFASAFSGVFDGIKQAAGAGVDWIVSKIADLLQISPAQLESFKAAIRSAFDFSGIIEATRQKLAEIWAAISGFFSAEKLTDGEKAEMYAAGRALGESIINGIKEYVASWIKPIQDMFKFALEIEWPAPPAWLTWLMEKSGNLFSGEGLGGGSISDWWSSATDWGGQVSGQNAPQPQPIAPVGMGFGSEVWDELTGASTQAGNDLSQGGAAVREGGMSAGADISAAGKEFASYVRGALAGFSASGNRGNVTREITSSRTGALHGGTD